jgi:MFS family permease
MGAGSSGPGPPSQTPERRAGAALLVLFSVNLLNFYDRSIPGALAEPIRKEFHLSDAQLGALFTVFTLVYAVIGVPLGRMADLKSRKSLLAGGVTLWTALTALSGLAMNYATLLLTRIGVACGEAVCAPAAASWIGDLYPADRRSQALASFMLAVPLGVGMSMMISGPVAQAFGWRTAMVIAAVPALLLVPALLMLREPQRGAADRLSGTARGSVWSVLRIPALWWIIASGAVLNFFQYAFSAFLPAFLTRYHGLPVGRAGFWAGAGHAAAGVLAAVVAGYWGDRVIRWRRDGRMLSASTAALLAAAPALFGLMQPPGSVTLALVLIMLAYGLLNTYYGFVYSVIQDIVEPGLRGTAMAVYFLAMYLLGASFGPLIVGSISDAMARRAAGAGPVTESARAAGLHDAMFVIPALAVVLAVILFAGSRAIGQPERQR